MPPTPPIAQISEASPPSPSADRNPPRSGPHPQPLGLWPPPAGLLLLPELGPTEDSARVDSALDAWMSGDSSQAEALDESALPSLWRFFARALAGEPAAARTLLAAESNTSWEQAYNLWVLDPEPAAFDRLKERADAVQRLVLEASAYVLGLTAEPPPTDPAVEDQLARDGALAAHVEITRAAFALEQGQPARAVEPLRRAIERAREVSPVLTAHLLMQLADVADHLNEDRLDAVDLLRDGLERLDSGATIRARAELALALGTRLHDRAQGDRAGLLEAAQVYQKALQAGLSETVHADLFAQAHLNLGTVYAAVPARAAGDPLKMALAVQSFRAALAVSPPETHPERWAAAQLNLANALQYTPSAHPRENLEQAVALYDEVLRGRPRAADPVGYARALASRGNALAHLGRFGEALENLNEAHKLFHWYNEADSAASVLDLVDRIAHRRAELANESPGDGSPA